MSAEAQRDHGPERDETEIERVDRNLTELLEELCYVVPLLPPAGER